MHINILTIPASHGLLTPISGAQARLFHLVKRLKDLGANVVVLEDQRYATPQERELVTPYYFKDISAVNRHLIVLRDVNIHFIKGLLKAVKSEKIDIIELSYPAGIIAAKCIIKLAGKKIPLVFSPTDVLSQYVVDVILMDPKYNRLERRLLPLYVRFMEWFACRFIADQIIAVSERDRDLFVKKYRLLRTKTSVIPSGSEIVDVDACYRPNLEAKCELGIDQGKITIFFHGLYSHPANKEAIDIIISYIAPKFIHDSRVQFLLGGTEVPEFLCSNVRSLGFIQDLPKALANVDIAIVPLLRGGGTRLKVLDYMAARLPIVTTKKGAEGINITNGEQAIIVDSVGDEFIGALTFLIDNEKEREKLGANARSLAEQRYNWDKIGDSLYELYEQLLSNG
jgi:glycosyltransferase involved in cell wall biosynthesis